MKFKIFLALFGVLAANLFVGVEAAKADTSTTCSKLAAKDWQIDRSVANRIFLDDTPESAWVDLAPDHFSPLTASGAELATFGYPPRPSDLESLNVWEEMVATLDPILTQDFCQQPALSANETSNTLYYSNWGGFLAQGSAGSFIGLETDFIQPNVNFTACASAQAAAWIGLGGTQSGTDGLIQMGTVISSTGVVRSWYEYLNKTDQRPPVYVSNFTVSPGDRLHFYISRVVSDGWTTFSFTNLSRTTKNMLAVRLTIPSGYYDGSTAEWIMERPYDNVTNAYTPFADYGTIVWTNMNVQIPAGTYATLGSQNAQILVMKSAAGKTLDSPSALSSSTVGMDSWAACK